MSDNIRRLKISTQLDPDDFKLIQYMQSRYASEGVVISQAEILRKILKPPFERLKERFKEDMRKQQNADTSDADTSESDEENDNEV